VIKEIESSLEGSLTQSSETTISKQASLVPGSKQASTETSPPTSLRTSASRPGSKRKVSTKQGPAGKPANEPKTKRVKASSLPSPNLDKFLKRSVVRGKIVKVTYFKE